jgi:hypothetical protein
MCHFMCITNNYNCTVTRLYRGIYRNFRNKMISDYRSYNRPWVKRSPVNIECRSLTTKQKGIITSERHTSDSRKLLTSTWRTYYHRNEKLASGNSSEKNQWLPNLRLQPRICLQILRNITQQVSESRLENKTLWIFNKKGDNSTVYFGHYNHQVTALTAVFL